MMPLDGVQLDVHPLATLPSSARVEGRGAIIIDSYAVIEDNVVLGLGTSSAGVIRIGSRSKIKYGAVLRCYDGWIHIGARASVGEYCVVAGHGGVDIADAVIIAAHCYLTAADHIVSGTVATRFQGETAKGIEIQQGAWIGARAVVLDGVSIGHDCIVGAGSVVTRSLDPCTLCLGSPCRVVRSRWETTD